MLCATLWLTFVHTRSGAHDLGIDQLVIWPERASGMLRGEITFDPELTRARDATLNPKHEAHVRAFLADQLRLEVDGDELSVNFVVRELWVPGGAVPGDIVVFTAALAPDAEQLRVSAGSAFRALVVSIQNPTPDGHSEAWSWLLRGGEWTPRYSLASAPAADPQDKSAWQRGGPELFSTSQLNRSHAPGSVAESSERAPEEEEAGLGTLALRFIGLGYEHILPLGIDHLLFVAGLVLGAVRNNRRILLAVTWFTVAHTLTLALSQTNWVCAPPHIVEPLIALSICLVGVDNLRAARNVDSVGHWRRRQAVVFAFGLVHGLGFGTALAEMHFAREQLLVALLSFNLGVELGQITFVLVLLAVLHWIRDPVTLKRFVVVPGSCAIVAAGLVFAALRVLG